MKYCALLLMLVSQIGHGCSCYHARNMTEVAKNSSVIFYGEVIGLKKIGKTAKSGSQQLYRITLNPQEVFKGQAKNKYVFNGYGIYNDKHSDEVVVGGCGLDLELGSKYIVMVERGKKIDWSWCSEHAFPQGSEKYDYFMKEIKNNL